MNRIFEKLYAVKWLELLKVSAECQLFSNSESSFVISPVSKRFCRRLAKDKLESGQKSKIETSPQITWRAMLKRNEVKPKKKHKKEVSNKKTQSEYNIRDSVKTTVKTRTNPQIQLKPKNDGILSKIPKFIKGSNFGDDGLQTQKMDVVAKSEATPEMLAPKIASVQEEIRKVKFLFVPVDRSDIPPPKDLNILTTIQNQVGSVSTEIDNKSNLQDYISRPKISIKSLKPLKSLDTAAKTFKISPLTKQNQSKHAQSLFERAKTKPTNVKSPARVPVPKISDKAREAMKKNQIYDNETMKIVKPIVQNPSVTILKQAKFPDKTPVIQSKPLIAKSDTFTIETRSILRPPPPPDLVPLKNVILLPQDIIPVKPSKSKLPRMVANKTSEEKKVEEKSLLPQVIEPKENDQSSCWKLMNNDVLEPLKKKLASKIPIRNINDHPLLLETGKSRKKMDESVE